MQFAGIALYVAGLWTLSALDVTSKLVVSMGVSVLVACWFRYLGHVLVMTVFVLPKRGRSLLHTRSLARQLQRGMMMIVTTLLFFSLLRHVPLAEATALTFLAPLFLLALAPWLLGESNRVHRWVGVLVGFAGMLVVIRPGGDLSPATSVLGVLTALSFTFLNITTRRVAHDDPLTTNYYGGLVGAVGLTIALPLFWKTPQLTLLHWLLLGSMGVTGFLAHWLQIAGFRRAPASLLAPYTYLQILSAALAGWLVFGHLPGLATSIGIALICLAGAGVALVEARRLRAVTA